jgi:hypothetical protein
MVRGKRSALADDLYDLSGGGRIPITFAPLLTTSHQSPLPALPALLRVYSWFKDSLQASALLGG